MLETIVQLGRVTVLSLSLIAAEVAVAQELARASDPRAFNWTLPASREALGIKGSEFLSEGTGVLATQFNHVFGGIPSPEVTLADGTKLYSACELHNCLGERAFLVMDSSGKDVRSAGTISVKCAVGDYFLKRGRAPPASCDTVPTLTIYYPGQGERQPSLTAEIVKWARSQVAKTKQSDRLKIREQFVH